MANTIVILAMAGLIFIHASGKYRFNKILVLILCLISIPVALLAAYIGYLNNPNKDKMKFREVL